MHSDDKAIIEKVQRLTVEPGEVLVFKVKGKASPDQVQNLSRMLRDLLGNDHKVLILDDNADVFVMTKPS